MYVCIPLSPEGDSLLPLFTMRETGAGPVPRSSPISRRRRRRKRMRAARLVVLVVVVVSSLGARARAADYAVGADLSFLKQAEDRGIAFKDEGEARPGLRIFKDHGYNWVRLR